MAVLCRIFLLLLETHVGVYMYFCPLVSIQTLPSTLYLFPYHQDYFKIDCSAVKFNNYLDCIIMRLG
jgi:hypothetical protein